MTSIDQKSEVINNIMFITEQFGDGQYVTVTFFDKEGHEVTSLLHFLHEKTDNAKSQSDLINLVQQTYMERPDVDSIAVLILNQQDIESASDLGHLISRTTEFDVFDIRSITITDGIRWHDIINVDGGEVSRGEITDFQLRQIVEGDILKDYPVY
jgi:hypothetical protein